MGWIEPKQWNNANELFADHNHKNYGSLAVKKRAAGITINDTLELTDDRHFLMDCLRSSIKCAANLVMARWSRGISIMKW